VSSLLPVLNLEAFDPGTYALSPAMSRQLDQAFRAPFPASDFGDRDRFPDWEVVARSPGPAGARWLVREGARAHIWVDVDAHGQATGWTPCSRAEARARDRAHGLRPSRAVRARVADQLPAGSALPDDLAAAFGKAWLHHRTERADGSGEALWSLGPSGLVQVAWDAQGRVKAAEPLWGDAAFEALRAAAQATGEWEAHGG
jgi:hypothetical protein